MSGVSECGPGDFDTNVEGVEPSGTATVIAAEDTLDGDAQQEAGEDGIPTIDHVPSDGMVGSNINGLVVDVRKWQDKNLRWGREALGFKSLPPTETIRG